MDEFVSSLLSMTFSAPVPQRSRSLHEQTYHALRAAILSGELAAGVRLVETQLADRLQVSRTPIREAIRQLEREQMVTSDAHGSLRVAQFTVADAMQLYDCRLALEQMAIAEACRHATDPQLAQIEQVIQQAEAIVDEHTTPLTSEQRLQLDYRFHHLLAECSGNGWLVQLLDQVFDKMAMLRLRTLQQDPNVLEMRGEHRRIFAAVCDRDPMAATQAIQYHLIASKDRVVQTIRQL